MAKKITQFFKETPSGVFDVYVGYIAADKEIVFRAQRVGAGLHVQGEFRVQLTRFIAVYIDRPAVADEVVDDVIAAAARGAL